MPSSSNCAASTVLAGIALPLLILSHLQDGGGWSPGMLRWSSFLGQRLAATINDWCSAAFLALPVLALVYALVSWVWKLVAAAGSQVSARRAGQQPLLSLLVLAIVGAGAVLIVIEVLALWPSGGPDNHWPLRLLVTWAVVLLLSGAVRRFLVQYLGDVAA